MDDKKWFKPAEGITVLDPVTFAPCPPDGKSVFASDEYWHRRVLDDDGEYTDPPADPPSDTP